MRVVKLIISSAICFIDIICWIISGGMATRAKGKHVILYYHALPSSQLPRFVRQMDLLVRWARPVAANFSGPLDAGRRYAAVTFDDGFVSVVQRALPELKKRGIPCTVFIVSDLLGKVPLWAEEYSGGEMLDRFVTEEELVGMPSELVTIGSHTETHPALTCLNQADAMRELVMSRAKLEKLLGRKVELFSFPFGDFNQSLIALCREAGYTRVFTTLPTRALLCSDEYVSGRVAVETSDWNIEFCLKLFGAYRWLPYAFSFKRQMYFLLGMASR